MYYNKAPTGKYDIEIHHLVNQARSRETQAFPNVDFSHILLQLCNKLYLIYKHIRRSLDTPANYEPLAYESEYNNYNKEKNEGENEGENEGKNEGENEGKNNEKNEIKNLIN
jgi:flagellar biosynthesis/type III secretory pathway protein FliH